MHDHKEAGGGRAERVQVEATRAVERLRTLGSARLARPDAGGESVAQRAHQVAQRLADLSADAAGRRRRPLPRLPDLSAGDQLAVVVADVLAEGDDPALASAADELTALRRSL